MNDQMLMNYLRSEGMGSNMSDYEFMEKFKEFMHGERRNNYGGYRNSMSPMMNSMRHNDYNDDYMMNEYDEYPEKYRRGRRGYGSMRNSMMSEHFDESYAKQIVSNMYHNENGRKVAGERYNMFKAKEICDKYKGALSPDTTIYDVYVAVNAQYHDYGKLFRAWFGNDVDEKVIESAILFWFKDEDYKHGSKLWNYFNM